MKGSDVDHTGMFASSPIAVAPGLPIKRLANLTPQDVAWDCQMHTSWTDGAASVEEMIGAAVRKGLKGIAITEHVRSDTTWFPEFRQAVEQAREQYPIPVLIGIEAKAVDFEGTIDASAITVARSNDTFSLLTPYASPWAA